MKRTSIIVLCLTGLVFGINKTYRRPQANTVGLIAHYKLWDGLMTTCKVFDYSLNGHGGTLNDTDSPITLVPTYPGFDFDGGNDYIEIADHADFSPILTPFSISGWCNMTDATNFIIVSKYNVGATLREWLFYSDVSDKLFFHIYDETNDTHITRYYNTTIASYQGTWIHVVGTYDGTTSKTGINIYLNGVKIDDTDGSSVGALVSCRDTNTVVSIATANSTYAVGLIDNVMLFSTELSAIEVKNLYNHSRWRYQR